MWNLANLLLTIAATCAGPADAELTPPLATLQAVGPRGAGQSEAAGAWRKVAAADARQLPVILAALDRANPLAANWIATAVDAVAQHQLDRGGPLPTAQLEAFVRDTRHSGRARRLAYEWLVRADKTAPARLVPGMIDDPSPEMRRDAVARLIGQADAATEAQRSQQATAGYEQALAGATDLDQVRLLTERLQKAGRTVDVPRHLGLIVRWKLIGPFDNRGEKGFDIAYPPEREFAAAASHEGKHGPVRWVDHVSSDEYGQIDLNRVLGTEKGVVGYATVEFLADRRREVEFRLTSFNALKLWLNGKLIDEHKVYHGGSQMDQYVSRAILAAGRNRILVKICQNEQTQDWAVHWWFQLRVCDERGKAVLSTDR
ncbi:MAG: hypothetical protein ABSG68_06900 [Thermoguttaceae bacterium]